MKVVAKFLYIFMLLAVLIPEFSWAADNVDCTEPIPELFKKVSPSVVFISAVNIDPLKEANRVSSVIGSGFIISGDGLVLTNSHVVFGRQAITITLDDGRKARAKLLGADPLIDLAVLRIPPPPEGHPQAKLGDSDRIQIGEEVIAIGNPLGLEQTLTRGVISGLNRMLPISSSASGFPLIQTDTPINPGNSGGPLVNRCGEVIGINSIILSEAQNIGFAVPINLAKQVIPELVEKGKVSRPWFGISGRFIKKEVMQIINLPLVDGLLVEAVEPDSPAGKAGVRGGELPITLGGTEFLLGGDVITKINDQAMEDPKKFLELIRSLKVGDQIHLTLYREGETREVEFRLTERPLMPWDFLPASLRGESPAFMRTY